MLWLSLYFPRLAIEVFSRSDSRVNTEQAADAGGRLPLLAVCDRLKVLLVSADAEQRGVRPGMKRATALALAPDLLLIERDPQREHEAIEQLACWLLQFTPSVTCAGPGLAGKGSTGSERRQPGVNLLRQSLPRTGLLLEIEPSLQLFDGLEALLERICTGLKTLGFTSHMACAPTARGAWLLSGLGQAVIALDQPQLNAGLAALPVMLLDAAGPHRDSLEAIGVRTVRELLRLPRAGLARRFGQGLLDEIDQALGARAQAHAWFEAPPVFRVRLELLADIEEAQALLFAAHRMLMQMTGWLGALHSALRDFELLAEHDDRPATCWQVRMTEPSRDLERMTTLLRERLANTRLPAPVHTLILASGEVVPSALPNRELFPTARTAHESLARLIERLQARLGRRQIQRLSLAEDHRPEAAYRIDEIDEAPSTEHRSSGDRSTDVQAAPCRSVLATSLPRPLWLLPAPIPVSERNNRPYWRSPLNLLAGPERIESGWWDGALVQRDYFIAEDDTHLLYWIYRERLANTAPGEGWFIQGRFG